MPVLVVLLPFFAALAVAMLPRAARGLSAALAGGTALLSLAVLAALWPEVSAGEVPRQAWPWLTLPGLPPIDLVFRVDGLALVFSGLVAAIGALVVLYARYYLSPDDAAPRFFACLLAFMGAMQGMVLAGNLALLVVFWELTSISSFLLIGFWNHREDARRGARMALAVTGAGGLALLGGVLMLGAMADTLDLGEMLAAGDRIRAHELYVPALLLVLLGAFTKSAQFPFHFWLPHAMAAPTPVSAYLHSATMVKAGVFLLARLWPVLSGTPEWFWIVSATGLATLVLGAWIAIFQHDLKGLLAYSTISHLGLITLLFGLGTPLAAVAGVFHILNHATFKASLFMAAGIIDHETGSRDMRTLNGLARHMPITFVLAATASAAMAGVPLLNGFLSKEMFLAETLLLDDRGAATWVVPAAATLAGALAVAYSLRFVQDVFFNGELGPTPRVPHEPPRWMRVPVELLVALCVLVGLFPALTVGPLLAVAAAPVVGGTLPEYSLALWHGVNAPLLMSLAALAGGIALYVWLMRRLDMHALTEPPLVRRLDGRRIFERLSAGLQRAGDFLGEAGSAGRLQPVLVAIVATALAAACWPLLRHGGLAAGDLPSARPPSGVFVALWGVGIVCALGAALRAHDRLHALLLAGGAGLVVAMAFAWFSAPDLALTQLLVEVASTLLLALVLARLPRRVPRAPASAWKTLIAVGGGTLMAALSWAVMTRGFGQSISPWFLRNSYPGGGGGNAVNVIIVDFRGLDTLGEIAVLGMAALAVSALLRESATSAPAAPDWRASPLLANGMRLLLPFAGLFAAHLFLRGHDLPGGGFVAGLVVAIALLLRDHAGAARLPAGSRWIGTGLMLAGGCGAAAWLAGRPFLTSAHGHPSLPWVGEVPIASAAVFDAGVFCAVVGATVLALGALDRAGARKEAA